MRATTTVSLLLACALAVPLAAQSNSSSQPALWAIVTYSKVPNGKMPQFEEAQSTLYRKMMEGRIAKGEVSRFVATRMVLPAGSDAKYNYVTATLQTGVPTLDRPLADLEKDWTNVGLKRAVFIDRMTSLGATIVKREVWRNLELVGTVEVGDFLRIDTKKVAKNADYVNLERTFYKPYWTERMKQGALKGWALYYVQLPGGEDRPYSYATVQWFKDEQQMFGRTSVSAAESWKVASPGTDPYQVNRDISAISHSASVELGRVTMVLRGSGSSAGSQ